MQCVVHYVQFVDLCMDTYIVVLAETIIYFLKVTQLYMLQEQYIFIHDAILEAITCGDTQIVAGNLGRRMDKLSRRDPDTHLTGYDTQFMASHMHCFI